MNRGAFGRFAAVVLKELLQLNMSSDCTTEKGWEV